MPANGYDGPVTLAAGVNKLSTVLQAAGYTGRFGFIRANLRNDTGADIAFARRSDVDLTNGRTLGDGLDHEFPVGGRGTIDMNKMYVYSAAGGVAMFSGETR